MIKRVYEIDPPGSPKCGDAMKIISCIERRQTDVIQRVLHHCGLWLGFIRTDATGGPITAAERVKRIGIGS
ncbi:MAG: hypothetical protein GY819_19965 [Planctomycetaceae bacterium]|nr:hypothetical protein [Planctomycetaceae bacterium]